MRGPTWSSDYLDKTAQLLERDIYPELGALPIDSITSAKVLAMARKIEARGAFEMPRRALVAAGQIFKFAIGLGHIQNDPAQGMTGQLNPRPPVQHYPHVTVEQLPDMLTRLDALRPNFSVYAVKLDMLTFIRGGELRFAAWDEFDLDKAIWTVPTGRMKGRLWQKENGVDHIVPLSRQAIALLKQLQPLTGWGRLVFPGRDDPKVGVSAAAMNGVFDRIGLKGEQTVHGLRGLASTVLNDSGLFDERAIEAQLAHKEPNKVRAAYNHAAYMAERIRLIQWWADYLDRMAAGNIVPITRSA